MIREIDSNLISPEKLFSSSDMARLGCGGCEGCYECCRDRAGVIVLDPWDIRELKNSLNYSFDGLMERGLVELSVIDKVVLPGLGVKPGTDECVFLDERGMCSIHSARPGICRMFPLARLYHEDGSFSYFIQEGECPKSTGVKVKISKWLGYKDVRAYEAFVRKYHDALKKLRSMQEEMPMDEKTALQRRFLEYWFVSDEWQN